MKNTDNVSASQVVTSGREQGISYVLFRNAVGAKLGISITDMECLDLLFFRKISTPTELARYTGLSSGATTAMLDRLERSGLIERRPNPKDRRGTLICIAKQTSAKVGPLFASARDAQQRLLRSYSKQERALLIDYFGKSAAMWESERAKIL